MIFKRIYRLTLIAVIVVAFCLAGLVIHFLFSDLIKRRQWHAKSMSFWCKLILKVFNIKVNYMNLPQLNKTHLIVANHQGYLDIVFLAAAMPSLFVTSVEMKETPGLGLITEMGGCLYVERRSREKIIQEIKNIGEALHQGFNVVIYPEGTSTNGEKILPFKKSLLTAAASVDANILPAVMNYRKINGEKMSKKFTDYVCWYGEMSFIDSIWNATLIETCEVDFEFLNEVHVDQESDRREVASMAQSQIEQRYIPIIA